jgi:hypothetical protein
MAAAATNRAVLAVYRPLLEPLDPTHLHYLVMLALPAVVQRLGVDLARLDELRRVLTRVNSAAPAAGALDAESPDPTSGRC